jgi:hypothetical protein
MKDDEIHHLLSRHPARLRLASSFDREVWSRIEAENTRTLDSLLMELFKCALSHFARPVTAACTLILFSLTGIGMGWNWHRRVLDARAELSYKQAINPFYHAGWGAGR